MPHIEQLNTFPIMEKQPGGSIFDAQDPIDAMDRQLLLELLNPLLGTSARKSGLITSGYLAAKAKMATAKNLAPFDVAEVQGQVDVLDGESQDVKHYDIVDHQKLQWSRQSSPGPVLVRSPEVAATADFNVMESLTPFNSLRGELKHHQLQHFCDDHNIHIKWRRRTLIFEKTP